MKKIGFTSILLFFSILHVQAESIPFVYDTPGKQTILHMEWNEKWFGQKSSYEYHHGIARIASFFSAIAYNTDNLEANYRSLRFLETELHYDVDYTDSLWGNDQCAFSIASKEIDSSNGKRSLVIVNIRGTPLNANEWLSNLNINNDSQKEDQIHRGFATASSVIHTALISYLLRHRIDPTDSYILITGHSRGAAVSNLLGKILYEDKFFKPENSYVYTFASPNVTTSQDCDSDEFGFIWNIVNAEDVVPTVPFYRDNWHFRKYGHTKTLSNYTNTDQSIYLEKIVPGINELYNRFFDRDYCPFYTGPIIPIYITKLFSRYVENVEIFYKGFYGLHKKAVDLMYKLFPTIENNIEEKKASSKTKFINRIKNYFDSQKEGFTDYISLAFTDMHQMETYMSYLLSTEEELTYSDTDYTLVILEGAIEAAVYDENNRIYMNVVEGLINLSNQNLPVVAIPAMRKQLIVGVPSNMKFTMFVTDDTILSSPAKIKLEHFNSAGVYKGSTEPQRLYLNRHNGYKFSIGVDTLNKPGVRERKTPYRERTALVDAADLKPEYKFRLSRELSFNSNVNLSYGVHFGIPKVYGTALLNHDLTKITRGVDVIAGIGHTTPFYGRISLDTELLLKTCLFTYIADTEKRYALVPQLRISVSRNLIRNSSIFAACTLDFNIHDFNDDTFNKKNRRQNISRGKINDKVWISPAIQLGFRF